MKELQLVQDMPQAARKLRIPYISTWWRYINIFWRYPRGEKRDTRLDLLRGFAVIVMVVDHFGGASWLYLITGNNSFYTSGAEAFVLISGLVVGMVYGAIALRDGLRTATGKALARAWTLYKLTVVMTIAFAIISEFLDLPWAKGYAIGNPIMFVVNVIILHQTYYLADIPLMYTMLMAMSPIGLWLLYKKRTDVLVIGSGLVWVGFQFANLNDISIWPVIGNTTFHVAAWQLIFFWAMAAGFHRASLEKFFSQFPRWPYLLVAGAMFLALLHLYATDVQTLSRMYPTLDMPTITSALFNKSTVGPGRIIATLIVFQFGYLLLTQFWAPFQAVFGWLLSPLGQNSLYSYTMHVVIIGTFYVLLPYLPGNLTSRGLVNTSLQLGVLFALWWLIRRQFAFDVVPR